MYLTPADYDFQIRSEIKKLLQGQSKHRFSLAETAAVGQMKSFLSRRYDTAKIFFQVSEFDFGKAYVPGNLVYYKEETETEDAYKVYECIQISAGGILPTDTNYFAESFKRDPFIIMYLVDITLYHLYSAQARLQMSEPRITRYDEALEWLKLVGAGKLDADLPYKAEEDETYEPSIRFGSLPKENYRY
jgi:phage gp36-like protein